MKAEERKQIVFEAQLDVIAALERMNERELDEQMNRDDETKAWLAGYASGVVARFITELKSRYFSAESSPASVVVQDAMGNELLRTYAYIEKRSDNASSSLLLEKQ